MKAGNLDIGK